VPFTDEFFDAITDGEFSKGNAETQTTTVDADELRRMGTPIRVATVNVDGDWYPSMTYTIADYALRDAGKSWPDESIPARGADSPDEAVRDVVDAVAAQDAERFVELLPPDVMRVYHDAGPLLLADATPGQVSEVEILDLDTETSDVSGGTRVEVVAVDLRTPDGIEFTVRKDDECY